MPRVADEEAAAGAPSPTPLQQAAGGDDDDGKDSAEDIRRANAHRDASSSANPAGDLATIFAADDADGNGEKKQKKHLLDADPRDHRDAEPDEEELLEAERGDDSNCMSDTCCGRRLFTARWVLVFLCVYVILQGMAVTGLFASSLSSIERRYGLSSTTTGSLSSTYDATVLSTTWIFAHWGKRHPLRWLASGLLTVGVGSLLFASPHAIGGNYNFPEISNRAYCLLPLVGTLTGDCSGSPRLVVATFFFAQVVIGLGSSPLHTLSPAYFDSVVKARHLPMYLGIFYACAALGPALGFVVQGLFLSTWVDGSANEPAGVDPDDPQWVGAWWQGYIVVGILCFFACVPLYLFPKWVPRTRHIRRRLRRHAAEAAVLASASAAAGAGAADRSLRAALVSLASNRTFVFNCLGQASEAFMVAGFSSFLAKAAESLFRLTASDAAFFIGATLVPGAAGGIFFGGWLMKRLRATTGTAVKSTFVIASVSFLFMWTFAIGCGSLDLAGVTQRYPAAAVAGETGPFNLTSACNAACDCDPEAYLPVAGDDGLTYFSACHAGCRVEDVEDEEWSECECMPPSSGRTATAGKANDGCTALGPFLFFLFLAMFATFANNVPATQAVLGATSVEHRPMALAVQSVTYRTLGFIPGPIVFGALVDQACRFEEVKCLGTEKTGSCWEYDSEDLRASMVTLALTAKALSMIFFGISYYFFRRDSAAGERAARMRGEYGAGAAAAAGGAAAAAAAAGDSPRKKSVFASIEASESNRGGGHLTACGDDDAVESAVDQLEEEDANAEVAGPGMSRRRLTDSELGRSGVAVVESSSGGTAAAEED